MFDLPQLDPTGSRALRGRMSRCISPLQGVASILLALPFTLAGIGIILVAADVIHVPAGDIHAPRWVLGMVGGVFALVGTFCELHGLRGLLRTARLKAQLALHADEPWYGDHDWDPHGVRDDSRRNLIRGFLGLGFLAFFLSIFNWWAFLSEDTVVVLQIIVGLFDAVLLLGLGTLLHRLGRRLKYGRSKLRFCRFPFFLGESVDVELENRRGIGRYDRITLTLRCIQERIVTRGTGRNRSTSVVCYEQYCDTKTIEGPAAHRAGDPPIRISFELPDGDYETCLRERPPRYWELEVNSKTEGIDYHASFVLPVYRKLGQEAKPPKRAHAVTFSESEAVVPL